MVSESPQTPHGLLAERRPRSLLPAPHAAYSTSSHISPVLRSKPSSYGLSSVGIHLGSTGRVESEIHSEKEAPSSSEPRELLRTSAFCLRLVRESRRAVLLHCHQKGELGKPGPVQ